MDREVDVCIEASVDMMNGEMPGVLGWTEKIGWMDRKIDKDMVGGMDGWIDAEMDRGTESD